MKDSLLQIRLDNAIKKRAIKLYEELGLDLSTAIRLFINKSLLINGLPFEVEKSAKVNKKELHIEASDLNKFMGGGKSLYDKISIDEYLKESRDDR